MKNYIINSISGIWNSYGCPPEAGSSVALSIEESGIKDSGSLKELCGFTDEELDIGQIADFKEISELIVMLPMVGFEETTEDEVLDTISTSPVVVQTCGECLEDPCGHQSQPLKDNPNKNLNFYYSITENSYLFKIDEKIINKILNVEDYKKLTIFEIKNKLYERYLQLNIDNTIVKLMFSMVNYYFPPHLNWLLNKDIPPICMYTAEFKTILQKKDLSDIWQGTMPRQAKEPSEEEIVIEHFFNDEELFSGYNLGDTDNLSMSVFKCKKIGLADYSALRAGNTSDQTNWYNYNWPYDNFSLVEYLQIQGGEVRDYKNDGSLENGVLIEDRSKTITEGNTTYTVPLK